MRILLVDDDRTTRAIVRYALSQIGAELTEVGRIADAKKAIAARVPDLVILDGLLPDGTGLDFLDSLRNDGLDSLKVVFLSSFFKDMATYKELKGRLHVAEILHKPVQPQRLADVVSFALKPAVAAAP